MAAEQRIELLGQELMELEATKKKVGSE